MNAKRYSILVVDDSRADQLLAQKVLESAGYTIQIESTCSGALQNIQKNVPDLVLLDVMLPDGNGYDLCRQIKEIIAERELFVPIMLITSKNRSEDKVIGFKSGADDYLIKPPASDEMIARVQGLLRMRDLQQDLKEAHDRVAHANRLIDREMRIIGDIQRSFLPQEFPAHPELELAAFYEPSMQAGGDYYDVIQLDEEHWGIVMADIAGHGISAAVVMAITQMTVKEFAPHHTSPSGALHEFNKKLKQYITEDYYVTMFYSILNLQNMEMVYSSAGHNPMLYYSISDRRISSLETASGFPLRTFDMKRYDERKVSILPGDKILLFTDGVTDIINSKREFYGTKRLEKTFERNGDRSPSDLIQEIEKDTEAFREGENRLDDFTLLIIGRRNSS